MQPAATQLRKFTNAEGKHAKAPVNTGAYIRVNSSQNVHESAIVLALFPQAAIVVLPGGLAIVLLISAASGPTAAGCTSRATGVS